MKPLNFVMIVAAMATVPMVQAQRGTLIFPTPPQPTPEPPPRVWVAPDYASNPPVVNPAPQPPPAQPAQTYVYDQKPIAGRPVLLTQEQAQSIINRFKAAYPKLGSPRFLIYVNRELVDETSGMKLIRRNERIESARPRGGTNATAQVRSTRENTYRADGKAAPTLADKQTVRDVERLFGRPLRAAGASLADQRVAAQLIADKPLDDFIGTTDTPQARKDREALTKVADVVIEVLISAKTVNVPTISGTQTISLPDIQATAIRLSDSKIVGQASSSDVTTRVPPATLGNFDVHDIADATALALMEDMTPE